MSSRQSEQLYLECYSGISGDMTVAALLDLGADQEVLRRALDSLNISGYDIEISRVKKAGLDVCDFHVKLDPVHENHDHDMGYLHGHGSEGDHIHGSAHVHDHARVHVHSHSHEHRGLAEIIEIIRSGNLTLRAQSIAEKIFQVLAGAESKAHGVPVEQVHFHEVGAVDSIVDIVAAAVCLDNLGIEQVIVPQLSEGHGTVRCQHGIIPVPVPAVCHIAEDYGLCLHMTDVEGELVTPTGAAIVAVIRTSDQLPENFIIEKTGMGAGKRSYQGVSGILRAMLIRNIDTERNPSEKCSAENAGDPGQIYKLESNIDDCTGELLGYVMECMFNAGARDVNYTPVYMKKNRPAYQLNVICDEDKIESLEQIIFRETTTIGIRRMKVERTVLNREIRQIRTPLGTARVKICQTGSENRAYPEYDTAVLLAREHNLPLQEVYWIIRQSWESQK